jgi:lipoate-protein ligase A
MVDQDLEHAMKWRILYVPQDIIIENEKIQGIFQRASKGGLHIAHERMLSPSDLHQDLKGTSLTKTKSKD